MLKKYFSASVIINAEHDRIQIIKYFTYTNKSVCYYYTPPKKKERK